MTQDNPKGVQEPFTVFLQWTIFNVQQAINMYKNEGYGFSLDSKQIDGLLQACCQQEIPQIGGKLIKALNKSDNNEENCNALALLSAMAICSSPEEGQNYIHSVLDALFDIIDFNNIGEISFDELAIFLMSFLAGCHAACLQGRPPHEAAVEETVGELAEQLAAAAAAAAAAAGRPTGREAGCLARGEFRRWLWAQMGLGAPHGAAAAADDDPTATPTAPPLLTPRRALEAFGLGAPEGQYEARRPTARLLSAGSFPERSSRSARGGKSRGGSGAAAAARRPGTGGPRRPGTAGRGDGEEEDDAQKTAAAEAHLMAEREAAADSSREGSLSLARGGGGVGGGGRGEGEGGATEDEEEGYSQDEGSSSVVEEEG